MWYTHTHFCNVVLSVPWVSWSFAGAWVQAVSQQRDPAPAMEQMHCLVQMSAHLLADDPSGETPTVHLLPASPLTLTLFAYAPNAEPST